MSQHTRSVLSASGAVHCWSACLVLMALCGCRSGIPIYPTLDSHQSLRVIAQRLDEVKTIQSSAVVEFEDATGSTLRLDAALAAQPPGSLRLRAWKFDRAVFDATLREGELWLLPTDEQHDQERAEQSRRAAEGIRRAFSLLAPAFYASATVDAVATTDRDLVVFGRVADHTLRCVIDRATLTPRRFEPADDHPAASLAIELSDYRLVGAVPWAHALTIVHPHGCIVIRMDEVVLNGDLAPGAFVAPRRAVKSP